MVVPTVRRRANAGRGVASPRPPNKECTINRAPTFCRPAASIPSVATPPRPYLLPPCGVPPPATRGCHPPPEMFSCPNPYPSPFTHFCTFARGSAAVAPLHFRQALPRGLRPRLLRSGSPCQRFPHAALCAAWQPTKKAGRRGIPPPTPACNFLSLRASGQPGLSSASLANWPTRQPVNYSWPPATIASQQFTMPTCPPCGYDAPRQLFGTFTRYRFAICRSFVSGA